ncbi:AraC family transcriptional regulator [Colwellia psychrerythraea]|uniref:Transcriptional regulator, AraC family n=1 Tax=Colwellia psychrerythraea TaxID=28229 RepID=A0A099KUF5_COLPS|nr:AraC family transcriptional regulator [Colwellia psychrerythraea]KGJ93830.1 transcriptional regulator, AraC family [Colwellia psychrerythraea]
MVLNNNLPTHFSGQVFAHKLNFISTTLLKHNIDLSRLLKGTNIDPQGLESREYKIHKDQVITFYRNVLALKIPDISLILGASIKPQDYGLYGCTLLCCKGLRATLEFAISYHNLVTKTVNMTLYDDKSGQSYFRFEDLLLVSDLEEFNIELQCVIVLSLIRDCLNNDKFSFDGLRFNFSKPKHHQGYEDFFACPITYNTPHNEFVFNNDKWSLNTPQSNPLAMPILLSQCDMVLNSVALKNEFISTVNKWVATNMHKELCAESLASDLYLTPRTLRRKLSEQGTSFTGIVKELRCSAAKKLITETQLTIEDVGCAIGFNDASNFRAAFKKWTGQTPSNLRQVGLLAN